LRRCFGAAQRSEGNRSPGRRAGPCTSVAAVASSARRSPRGCACAATRSPGSRAPRAPDRITWQDAMRVGAQSCAGSVLRLQQKRRHPHGHALTTAGIGACSQYRVKSHRRASCPHHLPQTCSGSRGFGTRREARRRKLFGLHRFHLAESRSSAHGRLILEVPHDKRARHRAWLCRDARVAAGSFRSPQSTSHRVTTSGPAERGKRQPQSPRR